jgi:uncharacterized membrane protein YhiD involved in acid resistance
MLEQLGLQAETIEAIIVALGTSFVGTGTVALIVKVALTKVTNTMREKVKQAELENKISTEQATARIGNIEVLEKGLYEQVNVMQKTIDELIQSQNTTNKNVQALLDEYKARDEQIKDLIVQEFGDTNE